MDISVLDTNLDEIALIDVFDTVIWSERYNEWGDFELHVPVTQRNLDVLQFEHILQIPGSKKGMFIETRKIQTDVEKGNILIVTGRSLETILERRIVWGMKMLTGGLFNSLSQIVAQAIVFPSDVNREIPNFIMNATGDTRILNMTYTRQAFGETLYDIIKDACQLNQLGFKVILEDKNFILSLYIGDDRSYDQLENAHVIFSPEYDNLINSKFVESTRLSKTDGFVKGEGSGYDVPQGAINSNKTGLARKETLIDASHLSADTEDWLLSTAEYLDMILAYGDEEIAKMNEITAFEGKAETNGTFKYDEDFFMGDIVQLENEYGMNGKSRITELVISEDNSGINIHPTFTAVEDV